MTVAALMVSLAGLAWLATFLASGTGVMPLVAFDPPGVAAFLALWVLGMVAMMFPVMVPTVLLYDHVLRTPALGSGGQAVPAARRAAAVPLFLGTYLVVYAVFGVAALAALYLSGALTMTVPALTEVAWIAPIAVLAAAGLYQLSPLKQRCLAQVHSPLALFSKGWRADLFGALRMGTRQGLYCVGCCWMYMIVMLAVGAMGLFWMAGLAVVLSVERASGRWGIAFSKAVAVGFLGAAVLLAGLQLLG